MNKETELRVIRVPFAKFHLHFGKLYVITDDEDAFEGAVDEIGQCFFGFANTPITPVRITSLQALHDNKLEIALMRQRGVTLAMMLIDPAAGSPMFAIQDSVSKELAAEMKDFVSRVDQHTRSCLTVFADNHPDDFVQLLYAVDKYDYLLDELDSLESETEEHHVSCGITGDRSRRHGGRRRARVKIPASKTENAEEDADRKQAKERFTQKVMESRSSNDSKTKDSITKIINSLPDSTKAIIIWSFMTSLTDEEVIEFYEKYIDMDAAARNSKTQIIVRERHSDKNHPELYEDLKDGSTKGIYRICYVFDHDAEHLFDFATRAETVVFLCCLMSKYELGDASVDFSRMKDRFIGAYRFVYGVKYEVAEAAYDTLLDNQDGQGRLKDYISNIRKAIDKELFYKEVPAVFYYKRNGHLGILKERITLPDCIFDEVARLADEKEEARSF